MESKNPLDKLGFADEKKITQIFESGQKLVLSSQVFKFNDQNKRQERNIMITNKGVYNLEKQDVKRKIDLQKVTGLTIGVPGSQFVIHVAEEYDYRFASFEFRDQILYSIVEGFVSVTNSKIPFFYLPELNLVNYTTTKDDQQKKLNQMPTTPSELTDIDVLKRRSEGKIRRQSQIAMSTTQLFSMRKGEKVTINDFNLLKVVGRGAFGKVMLVQKKDTQEIFALKSIRKEDIIDKDQIEHTKTQRIILEHCNHPFLVNLIYAFTTPEKIFFVTQFMKGGELFQHLRHSKRFDQKRARFYTAEITLALGHLHSQNIIYRDLKPENILMDEQGHICLTDFGMAKILRKDEKAQSFCGTPEYLSPEIIEGTGHNASCDWWALGIFTFEMMFALPPYYNQSQEQMFQAIQKQDIQFPTAPVVSEQAKDFITQCCKKKPEERLGSKKDMEDIKAHPWFAGIDWGKLIQKEVEAPFKPKIGGDQWTGNFDQEFIKEEPINSFVPETNQVLIEEYEDEFKDFSYVPKNEGGLN